RATTPAAVAAALGCQLTRTVASRVRHVVPPAGGTSRLGPAASPTAHATPRAVHRANARAAPPHATRPPPESPPPRTGRPRARAPPGDVREAGSPRSRALLPSGGDHKPRRPPARPAISTTRALTPTAIASTRAGYPAHATTSREVAGDATNPD